ncbi:MAG TPA: signal recognition particle-docking protein FtsY [Methanoculleus sp.]|mgnify:FL=1|uniref:signal recognition particle-docking protein FtsY n=1 Tax=Methanoculleus sp. TaxID=90427 RepID=UPI001B5C5229|nr:signal recognition particle-docking protein FtsY [Methanoculleus sp.]MBP7143924.1 signal recognition particle-docking protein FtsY [Methanoculleus sp.]HOC83132.1 signal recognition particle-docking protein FtsY [Methanoculleus sp.]HOZ43493.1 signal recognition particle-docking protein FtsY [Methanoculleus sp.]HQC33141.1 signal recognition particle-docking protein FtsY [Methanoculleus sp.]HQL58469.1 signal recognition particle-docking protein FtsY [Methanoculleus sp.]
MFDSLKKKLQNIRTKFASNIEEAATVQPAVEQPAPPPTVEPAPPPVITPAPPLPGKSLAPPAAREEKREDPTFFNRLKILVREREILLQEKDIEEPLMELEMVLLENDVALPVTDEIIARMKKDLVGRHRKIGASVDDLVVATLRSALCGVLGDGLDLRDYIREHERPVKILFTGVNGTGKTTTVAKVGHYLQKNGFTVVIGAGDTFRAGAIEQIRTHADRLDIKVIQHQAGADPSAVLFDAVQYAKAHEIDVVLADTAGRFHNRANLMNQLEKIRRVMKPDLVVYVDEAVAGNDAVIRAGEFNRAVGTDAVVLTKADMDSKGGAAISVAHTVGKPILFLGTGQGYDDIMPFTPRTVVDELLGGEA